MSASPLNASSARHPSPGSSQTQIYVNPTQRSPPKLFQCPPRQRQQVMWKSTPTPSQGKQQSISSFFTPKTANGVAKPRPSQAPQEPQPSPEGLESSNDNLYDAETGSESEEPLQSITNGSSKRSLAEDVVRRPSKRVKGDDNDGDGHSSFFPTTGLRKPSSGNSKITPIAPITARTETYMYSSSGQSAVGEEVDAATKARKEELHRQFVKKLGHPDSIAKIRQRSWQASEETEEPAEGGGDDDEDDALPPTKSRRKGAKTGKLTPLELQVLDIKRKHMDTILIVEVGYKFKFFGEDARIAAKELGIVCIPGKFRYDEHISEAHLDRFASASIPVHRLSVHAKRLVAAGHKIGVVRQIETAALKKAGDNRNTPFIRKLTNVYTKGTYIDDVEGLDQPTAAPTGGAPATGYLLCLTESKAKGWGTDEKVDVGILAVQPATGDIIYDTFEDGFMRGEIETRLLHIAPCEFLIVGELTKATEKLAQHLSGSSTNVFGDKIRVERVEKKKTTAAEAYSHVARFYADKLTSNEENKNEREQNLLDKVLKLPEEVTVCLSAMITHMTEYGLEHVFDLTKYFQSFSARSHMLLNGNTLTNLEIYQNQTDHTEKGSLFWTVDKTCTRFGQRLLRKWVGRPLLDKDRLEERVSAVEELKEGTQTLKVDQLRSLLRNIKTDLERSLLRIYYSKCTRPELLTALQTMQRIANEFAHVRSPADAGFQSPLINEAIASLPTIGDIVISFLDKINAQAARSDDKYAFFREEEETGAIGDHKMGIAAVEQDLDVHRSEVATKLKKKSPVTYVTVAGIEYLIEIPNTDLKNVPASWTKISGTKKLSRFHTPDVVRLLRERDQHKESLSAACDVAFSSLLSQVSTHYAVLRDSIASLALLDCLLSLATIASLPGYTKPTFTTTTEITVVEGRHPMVEQLLPTSYIPNNTSLSAEDEHTRALLITGPNMGGKSSYVRQVALISILAQIGSYVPAKSACLGLLDGIYTRMGAFDSLFTNQSTFMVELSETASILKSATSRSLVILDELGRGTSTHDGVAIASAVLDWVVRETKCLCLFITHYQTLAGVARGFEKAKELRNVHMRFTAQSKDGRQISDGEVGEGDGDEQITFLYEVGEGVAHRSYGLNVARLARVPKPVLETAALKSRELEMEIKQKKLLGLSKLIGDVLKDDTDQLDQLVLGIEEL
ncbi:DNA mismatch repair protein msh3 [Venustampulla echinocandica]|uniref:DNA mismatch repair protein MSH3 n=1 Tax=Venustampulla echinocandica TaxID=2656787 RepID=A0A370TX08_9HELO|nr:DNA mismatch repair protein msh3 [Venustampulla echinocandica]RDL40060.1 DNA mismatch repair protein msh3 [Venustampulla echinocandica]